MGKFSDIAGFSTPTERHFFKVYKTRRGLGKKKKACPPSNRLPSLVFSMAVDSQTFTASLSTMESVLYNNNLLPKAQKNKAGEKLSALF